MWRKYLENGDFLCALYDDVPSLVDVDISSIRAIPEDLALRFRLDLCRYADHPPKEWNSFSNTVRMSLVFFDCRDLDWKGWDCDNICNIEIKPVEMDRYRVQVSSDMMYISFTSGRIASQNIEPRCREDRE